MLAGSCYSHAPFLLLPSVTWSASKQLNFAHSIRPYKFHYDILNSATSAFKTDIRSNQRLLQSNSQKFIVINRELGTWTKRCWVRTSTAWLMETTNEAMCREFLYYNKKLFTREPGPSSDQFDTYLVDFPRLSATEAAWCEVHITKDEARQTLKTVGIDRSPVIDDFPYEVYLRLSLMFVPLLVNRMKQRTISRYFIGR